MAENKVSLYKISGNTKKEKKEICGKTSPIKIPAGMGGICTVENIPLEKDKQYIPFVQVLCNDQYGGLSYYICNITPKQFELCVENTTDYDRLVSIAYKLEFM
jgi:hypothetical protein